MKKAIMFLLALSAIDSVQATPNGQELIQNGNFAANDCARDWCVFKGVNFVKNWTPKPEIEVGFGRVYNSRLGRERVIELAPNANTCIEQNVRNLQPGVYQLKYEWAARQGRSFSDCQFKVKFNDQELKHITPSDYKINTEVIEFEIRVGCDGRVQFCGVAGQNNSYGAIIKSVSLVRKGFQPTFIPPVNRPPIAELPIVILPNLNIQPIGQPPTFFPPKENLSKITLDSHSAKCINKQYKLGTGKIEISFDYKLISNFAVKDSSVFITQNGRPIYRVLPSDNGKNIKILSDANQGTYTLGFCAVGSPKDPNHQVAISNIVVTQQQCIASLGKDLIVNGGFQQNQCGSNWCIWNQKTGVGKVTGWEPSRQIEVGKGTIYNKALGNSWIAELDPNANSCIRQRLVLRPGKHVLRFNWAGRSRISTQSNEFEVRLNGKALKSFKATNDQVKQEEIQFDLSECPNESWVEFCGTGKSDGTGALIDNVMLFRSERCASTKTVKY